ncbi:MAG: nucleoside-diphosphate-sugar pyrophosphorylase [Candidatus Nanosalina sp. J07AB43]|nr:MAG: nucleoside-diphosphate-sugar pyrophosphorylase [Candidatus Nanosalina sp. J07AB43]
MKAIVLAGGHATRLWPVTKNRAKPLLPLGDRPIIDYIVDDIIDEVDEIIISTNEKFADDFRAYIADEGIQKTARVVVENQDSEEDKPGTIGAIINLIETEELSDDLIIVGGDNYQSFDGSDFVEFCREKNSPANVVYDVKQKSIAKQIGIVDLEDDRIVDFEEKPEEPPSTLGSIAWYFFPSDDLDLFDKYEEHFRQTDVPENEYLDEPGRLIEWAHERTEMYAFSFDGQWFDVGTPKGYLDATASITDSNVVEGEVESSDLGDNVVVMEDAVVRNSSLENSIVFPEAKIRDSDVKNSIIDRHSKVQDVDLNDALIGEHTLI